MTNKELQELLRIFPDKAIIFTKGKPLLHRQVVTGYIPRGLKCEYEDRAIHCPSEARELVQTIYLGVTVF